MRILITDDSMVVRRSIQRFLTEGRVTTIDQARNGLEAVALYKQFRHGAITLDITMPEMDGIETVTEIMKIDPTARILIVSALADKATAIEAIKRGASGFICKPFSQMDLVEAFEELITD